MKSKIIFKTKSNNKYFYSLYKKQVLLCNPIFAYLLELSNRNINIIDWINNKSKSDANLKKIGNISKSQLIYYYLKYKFLLKYGYFKQINSPEQTLIGKLIPEKVKSNIVGLKQIIFEVTEKCNLKCKYCTYGKFYNNESIRSNNDFNLEHAIKFLKYIENLFNLEKRHRFEEKLTISFYGGEPLLNFPFINSIVTYLTTDSKLKEIVEFSMTINGLLLERHIDFLVEYDFKLAISLDGDKNNNQYRVFPNGNESFGKVMKNVTFVQNKYPKFFKENINFLSVLHNKNSLFQILQFSNNNFNKFSSSSIIGSNNLNSKYLEEFKKTFLNRNQKNDNVLLLKGKTFNRNPEVWSFIKFMEHYSNNFRSDYNNLLFKDNSFNKEFVPTGTCSPFSLRLYITVNGDILPCEHIDRKFKIGKLQKDRIVIDEKKIAKKYNGYYSKLKKLCAKCYNFKTCGECMFNNDSIEDESINCASFTNYSKFSKYFSEKISYIEEYPQNYKLIIRKAYDG